MSYGVQHYFLNGGSDAIIVRIENGATAATITLPTGDGPLTLEASSVGAWGNDLRATVDHTTSDSTDTDLFNLVVDELNPDNEVVLSETFRNVSMDADAETYVVRVLEQDSNLVRVQGALPADRPSEGTQTATASSGDDGSAPTFTQYEGSQAQKTGIYALEDADLFNLLVIPPFTRTTDVALTTWTAALAYCKTRRAMLIVDAPSSWNDLSDVTGGLDGLGLQGNNATNGAIFFPRVKMADRLRGNRLEEFAPGGLLAGVFARTDANRGVWKAPAGIEASMTGVRELTYKLTDGENGRLNPLGVNCLRTFRVIGNVVWGARTIRGADRLANEWKYIPVRRVALFIEESLYRGTQWAVFEPNDEPLWAQIRLNIGDFMHNLFRQGAFQGSTPQEAYLVKCDKETTTQQDINLGIVNILVGFAPLKPAEFVVIRIAQLAGQTQA